MLKHKFFFFNSFYLCVCVLHLNTVFKEIISSLGAQSKSCDQPTMGAESPLRSSS